MTGQPPIERGPTLAPFLLGVAGSGIVLLVLLYGLVWRTEAPSSAEYLSYVFLPLLVAVLWSAVVKAVFVRASHGVPAAGYSSVWAALGLIMLVPTGDPRYVAFLFVSFICLLLGRLGERAAKWVFPERFV